ncbi:type II 3-dehydroquinate dehydratase [Patescibacteria group bacterium]
MKILVINGPNLNMLGKRDKKHYGRISLEKINELLRKKAKKLNVMLTFYQSNHEGELIDFLQKKASKASGILINPGALTHYGYSLRDALTDIKLPIVGVHLSYPKKRENFRKIDILKGIALKTISGLKEKSYLLGLEDLSVYLKSNQ